MTSYMYIYAFLVLSYTIDVDDQNIVARCIKTMIITATLPNNYS